jgi:hypothetical protein
MIYILIAVFWSSATSSVFTAEFNTEEACKTAGARYAEMIDRESSQWVANGIRPGLPSPSPSHASYLCAAKGNLS